MTCRPIAICAFFALLSALPAYADATRMCLDRSGTTAQQCACATDALAAEVVAEDLTLYDKVGTLYLANKAAGQGMGDAWDAAIARIASEAGMGRIDLMNRMNVVGRAHRDAIKECE